MYSCVGCVGVGVRCECIRFGGRVFRCNNSEVCLTECVCEREEDVSTLNIFALVACVCVCVCVCVCMSVCVCV